MWNASNLKWQLILLFHLEFAEISYQSIAGVTYMDDFDFEERYRDVYECDPFHWHPLHLPEHCAEMYENLIRSRIAAHMPWRVVKEQEKPVVYSLNYNLGYPAFEVPTYEYSPPISVPFKVMDTYEKRRLSPYDKMFDLLRRDVELHPSAPTIGMMPNIGPVAVYHQPISKKSEAMIKKISGAYAKAGHKSHGGKYYGKIEVHGTPKAVDTTSVKPDSVKKKRRPKSKKPKIITLATG